MRSNLRGKNLEQVLTHSNASTLEKTTASKLLVEKMFEKNFGMTVGEFCAKGSHNDNPRSSYSSIAALSNLLDAVIENSKEKGSMQQLEVKQELPVLHRTLNRISDFEVDTISNRDKT